MQTRPRLRRLTPRCGPSSSSSPARPFGQLLRSSPQFDRRPWRRHLESRHSVARVEAPRPRQERLGRSARPSPEGAFRFRDFDSEPRRQACTRNRLTIGVPGARRRGRAPPSSRSAPKRHCRSPRRAARYLAASTAIPPTKEDRLAARAVLKATAKARVDDLAPIVAELRAQGTTSYNGIARALSEQGIPTARGGSVWTPTAVRRVLAALDA